MRLRFLLVTALTGITPYSAIAAEGMPQFNIKSFPSQIFWLILTFTCLYLIVSTVLLPRIRENIRLRKNKIANDIERAESIKKDVENMLLEYDTKIADAKHSVTGLIKKSIAKSVQECSHQIQNIKKQIDERQNEVEKNIAAYKNKVEKDMLETTVSLTSKIIKKISDEDVPSEKIKLILDNSNIRDKL